jgi:hypothetical protein
MFHSMKVSEERQFSVGPMHLNRPVLLLEHPRITPPSGSAGQSAVAAVAVSNAKQTITHETRMAPPR